MAGLTRMQAQTSVTAANKITLCSSAGLSVEVLPDGAYLAAIRCFGQDLTLSYPQLQQYRQDPCYLGATVGRYANRIRHGRFYLGSKCYQLDTNQITTGSGHCLHGGFGANGALHQQPWQVLLQEPHQLQLYLRSAHGSCGFPGDLQIWYHIRLHDTTVYCHYLALSDQDTVLNLTNHCYFNLNPHSASSAPASIDNHLLQSSASHYLPVDADTLPTGEICTVAGSLFDFQQPTELAPRLQQAIAGGYSGGFDHCLVWPQPGAKADAPQLQWRASLYSPLSGVQLQLFSNKPGLQLYTGQFLTPPFLPRQGICLEAQHWPDAPNQPHFPTALLKAGQLYQHQLCYQFLQQPINAASHQQTTQHQQFLLKNVTGTPL